MSYRNTRDDLEQRIGLDFSIPDGELGDCVVNAVVHFIVEGYSEAELLIIKYSDLICKWDGKLHKSSECETRMAAVHNSIRQILS